MSNRLDPARPRIPEVMPLLREFLAKYGPECGPLHVVLSDNNTEDGFVRGLADRVSKDTGGEPVAVALARILERMSRTQRAKLAGISCRVWDEMHKAGLAGHSQLDRQGCIND